MLYIIKTSKKVVKCYDTRQEAEDYIKEHPGTDYTIEEMNF